MAALRSNKLGYLLTNFAGSFFNHVTNFQKTRQALFHCSSLLFGPGQEIKMPSLSPTMEEGKIVKWLKKEGDPINPGDVLCDIETDKAIVSMEIEEEGILAKILVPENTTNVKVGSLIALMVGSGEDWKNITIPSGVGSSSSTSDASSSGTKEESGHNQVISGPASTAVKMPSLSPTMTSGTIVKWLKKEGDKIAPGDVLCDIQTDKAVMSLETEEEGILAKILAPDDSKDVKVGTLIALIVEEGEDWKNVVTPEPLNEKNTPKPQMSTTPVGPSGEVGGKKFGPAVKALLATYQILPDPIKPTGRGNMLLKEDVLKYIAENNLQKRPPKAVPATSAIAKSVPKKPTKPESVLSKKSKSASIAPKYKDIELTGMRQTIAQRLVQSKTEIPHLYSVAKCNVDSLLKVKDLLSTEGFKISVNDLLTKAVALALKMYPKANALCINNEVRLSQNVDVCVAVATDTGLYTPIIKSANEKSVVNISDEIRQLAAKAKTGKLKPEEFQGGTFTISNLGMFGVTHFKAIINPPQSGILAVGGTTESLNSDMKINKYLILSLSCDRRVLEDQEAAEFMTVLKYFIENPKLIIVDMNEPLSMRI